MEYFEKKVAKKLNSPPSQAASQKGMACHSSKFRHGIISHASMRGRKKGWKCKAM